MARQPPSTPGNATGASTSFFSHFHDSGSAWNGVSGSHRTSSNVVSSPVSPYHDQNTYLMPTSPSKGRQGSADYRPGIKKAVGNVPACLVNASVTYCGNDQIYAFGGFDQYTDEGW